MLIQMRCQVSTLALYKLMIVTNNDSISMDRLRNGNKSHCFMCCETLFCTWNVKLIDLKAARNAKLLSHKDIYLINTKLQNLHQDPSYSFQKLEVLLQCHNLYYH